MNRIIIITIAILLSACGPSLDGTYKDQMGLTSYTFKSGKLIVSTMGVGSEVDYKIEDGKIKIPSPQGTMVMDILEDGAIAGPMGMKLTKQKD